MNFQKLFKEAAEVADARKKIFNELKLAFEADFLPNFGKALKEMD